MATLNGLLTEVLYQLLDDHPLPWRVEPDWTQEVRAADGAIVAKFRTREEADALIAIAEEVGKQKLENADPAAQERLLEEVLRGPTQGRA
jgi:hypothetical protein